jgi:hypothetical protein
MSDTSVTCPRQVLDTPSHLCKGEKEDQPDKRGFTVRVELCPFNNRVLNRDVALLCEQVLQASPQFPDGRLLSFSNHSARCILPAQELRVTVLLARVHCMLDNIPPLDEASAHTR